MAIDESIQTAGDRPQWLGSLVRRGEQVAAQQAEPPFAEGEDARWLGSVARRENDAASEAQSGWTGSPVRSAVFSAPERQLEPPPAVPAETNVHELSAPERVVMGALGMTLRAA
jgi:hypothetical protein